MKLPDPVTWVCVDGYPLCGPCASRNGQRRSANALTTPARCRYCGDETRGSQIVPPPAPPAHGADVAADLEYRAAAGKVPTSRVLRGAAELLRMYKPDNFVGRTAHATADELIARALLLEKAQTEPQADNVASDMDRADGWIAAMRAIGEVGR